MNTPLANLFDGAGTPTIAMTMDLRERLQAVEQALATNRQAVEQTSQTAQDGVTAMNNRLTSQYQRIAKTEDRMMDYAAKLAVIEGLVADIKISTEPMGQVVTSLERVEAEVLSLKEVRRRWERTEQQIDSMLWTLKVFGPAAVAFWVVIEKMFPGRG